MQSECFYDTGSTEDICTLVLPDSYVSGLKPAITFLNLNYKAGVNDSEFVSAAKAANKEPEVPIYDSLNTKADIYQSAGGYQVMISYLALYIGIVFLIAAAAILALQQLSESSDNAERYGLLRKLGAEEKMIDHALFTQIALYFLLPLSLAIIHSIVGIHVANSVIVNLGAHGYSQQYRHDRGHFRCRLWCLFPCDVFRQQEHDSPKRNLPQNRIKDL